MKEIEMIEFLTNRGISLCGFCSLPHSPIQGQELCFAVSLAVKLPDAILRTIDATPSFQYFQQYRTANAKLDAVAFDLAALIEDFGYDAHPVAASQSLGSENPYRGLISHKTVAVLSGLGFVGKSGLFLSEKYGSKVRLATVLTNMPLSAQRPVMENKCGSCEKCKKACPAGAIYGTLPTLDGQRNFDPEKCSHYMKEHFQKIGRGSVCGICIKVCPMNHLS